MTSTTRARRGCGPAAASTHPETDVVGQDQATVVVGTFGDELGHPRPRPRDPLGGQPGAGDHVHGATLAQARNAGLEQVTTEYVLHLDADDEHRLRRADAGRLGGRSRPAVRHVWPSWTSGRRSRGGCGDCVAECLRAGNYCCIGTMYRTELARKVGWRSSAGAKIGHSQRAAGRRADGRVDSGGSLRRPPPPQSQPRLALCRPEVAPRHRAARLRGGHSVIRPLKVSILIPAGPRPRPASPH